MRILSLLIFFKSNLLKPINKDDEKSKQENAKSNEKVREASIGMLLEIIKAYYKPIKENSNCQLINMFNFEKEEDLETAIIRTLINGDTLYFF